MDVCTLVLCTAGNAIEIISDFYYRIGDDFLETLNPIKNWISFPKKLIHTKQRNAAWSRNGCYVICYIYPIFIEIRAHTHIYSDRHLKLIYICDIATKGVAISTVKFHKSIFGKSQTNQ